MAKFVQDALFGLGFGVGFMLAYGVCQLIVMLFSHAGLPGSSERRSIMVQETWKENIGAGGAFVFGFVAWKVWGAYQEELAYSKTRDRETLIVLNNLGTNDRDHATRDASILEAINELKEMIQRHMKE